MRGRLVPAADCPLPAVTLSTFYCVLKAVILGSCLIARRAAPIFALNRKLSQKVGSSVHGYWPNFVSPGNSVAMD